MIMHWFLGLFLEVGGGGFFPRKFALVSHLNPCCGPCVVHGPISSWGMMSINSGDTVYREKNVSPEHGTAARVITLCCAEAGFGGPGSWSPLNSITPLWAPRGALERLGHKTHHMGQRPIGTGVPTWHQQRRKPPCEKVRWVRDYKEGSPVIPVQAWPMTQVGIWDLSAQFLESVIHIPQFPGSLIFIYSLEIRGLYTQFQDPWSVCRVPRICDLYKEFWRSMIYGHSSGEVYLWILLGSPGAVGWHFSRGCPISLLTPGYQNHGVSLGLTGRINVPDPLWSYRQSFIPGNPLCPGTLFTHLYIFCRRQRRDTLSWGHPTQSMSFLSLFMSLFPPPCSCLIPSYFWNKLILKLLFSSSSSNWILSYVNPLSAHWLLLLYMLMLLCSFSLIFRSISCETTGSIDSSPMSLSWISLRCPSHTSVSSCRRVGWDGSHEFIIFSPKGDLGHLPIDIRHQSGCQGRSVSQSSCPRGGCAPGLLSERWPRLEQFMLTLFSLQWN